MNSHLRRIGSLIPAALVGLYGVGFLFHTSYAPTVLGKYNLRYAIFLAAWFFVLTPATWLLARFVLTRHEIHLRSGRVFAVGTGRKLYALVVIGLLMYLILDAVVAWQLATRTLTRARDRFHPYLQNAPRADNPELVVNRWGFRGEEIDRVKPAGTFRIFFFGGSTTICEQIAFEESHPRLLEKQLRAAYPDRKIEVQNLGAEWHCSEHSLIKLLTQAQEFSPDLVIVYHAINDLVRSLPADDFTVGPYEHDYANYLGPVVNLVRPRHAAKFLSQHAGGHWFSDFRFQTVRMAGPDGRGVNNMLVMFFPRAEPVEIDQFDSLGAFARNMTDFVQIAQAKKMKVLMLTQPSLFREDLNEEEKSVLVFALSHQFGGKCASLASMTRGMRQFNAQVQEIARKQGVPLVDLEARMPKTTAYMYDDCHYTKTGNELIGAAIAEAIAKLGLIGK